MHNIQSTILVLPQESDKGREVDAIGPVRGYMDNLLCGLCTPGTCVECIRVECVLHGKYMCGVRYTEST